jgi:pyruvate kinase
VLPIQIPDSETMDELIRNSIDAARRAGHIVSGQNVIITGGAPLHVAGRTNFIKVAQVD